MDIVLQCQDQMELKDVDCLARILLHRQGDGIEDQSLSLAHDWHPIDRVELRRGEIALTAVVRRGLDHLSRVEHPHLARRIELLDQSHHSDWHIHARQRAREKLVRK